MRAAEARGSVDHDQKLHHIFIDRRTGRLHDKNILSADILADLDPDFPFAETPDKNLGLFDPELLANLRRQRGIGVASKTDNLRMFLFLNQVSLSAKR